MMNFYGLDANHEENIIDVAKDYTCAAQTDSFNENYRKWRKDSSFGFHFVKDTKARPTVLPTAFHNRVLPDSPSSPTHPHTPLPWDR